MLAIFAVAALLQAGEPIVQRDVAYVEPKNERQTLDIYAPADAKNCPIMVWIHGGGWRQGDKRGVQKKPDAFNAKGFVFVSINYRFVPNVDIPTMTGDVAKAIRWVHDHASEFGGDPHRIFVAGHSAGAHLSALVATDESYLKAEGLSLATLKGCIPVDCSVYDARKQIESVPADRKAVYEKAFTSDAARQQQASPMTYVAKDRHIPPFLILHCADRPDATAQSQALAAALRDVGVNASAFAAEGKTHGTINSDLGVAGDKPTEAVFSFLTAIK